MKIKSLTINTLLVCLCWSLAGASISFARAAEIDAKAESVQPTLLLDRDLSLEKQASSEPKSTADQTKKSAARVKLRMSRSIHNFDALNKNTPEPQIIDAASFKQEADEEKKILAEGGTILEGDRIEVFQDRHLTALGKGILQSKDSTMLGDRIEFDQQSHIVHSVGNASMETKESLAKGPAFHLNLDDSTGEMPNASFTMYKQLINAAQLAGLSGGLYNPNQTTNVDNLAGATATTSNDAYTGDSGELGAPMANQSASSRGDAKMLFFEGDHKKRLLDARYTTCSADSDDWYIKSKELKIDDETKTAKATHTTIEFKGFPILYTPKATFPFAGQRRSGFLAPTWGTTTKSGFELLTPFYWNISPNMDAFIAARVLSKRGVQLQGQFRYMEENFSGIANLEYLPTDGMTDENRYYGRVKHQHSFNNGWSAGVDAQKVSDSQYFSDLSTHIISTSQVNLLQQANLNYSGDVWQFGALAQRYQTLDKASYPYQRLPQLTLNGAKDWDWGTTKIQNQLVAFDTDPNSTLPIKSAVRFNTYPSFSLPISRSYGYLTPKVGVHYTNYNLNDFSNSSGTNYESSMDRTVPIFSMDSGLFFERNTRIVNRNYTQTLEPRLYYVYIPYQDQKNLPVFDSGLMDLNMGTLFSENQYSGVDRINNANQVSYALTSRMIDADSGKQRLAASIGQRLYFEDQRVYLPSELQQRDSSKSDIIGTATLNLRNNLSINGGWQYNTDTSETVRANIGGRYNPDPGKLLNFNYRYHKNLIDPTKTLDQINVSGQWPLGKGFYTLGRLNYSIQDKNAVEALAGVEYDAGCWQSRFVMQRVQTATDKDPNYAFFFQLVLGGITSIGANPLLILNRNIPGYRSSGLLPDNYRQEYSE